MLAFTRWFWILAALLILTVPLKWLIAAVVAAAIHELGHALMIKLLGNRILGVRIGVTGAVIRTCSMVESEELLCALAGPMASFLLLTLYRPLPMLAICAAVQGTFNMLPVFPLDGGRVLRCLLTMLCPEYQEKIEESILLLLLFLAAAAGVQRYVPIWILFLILLRPLLIKIPCKLGKSRVQ